MFKFFTKGISKAIFQNQGASKNSGPAWLFTSELGAIIILIFIIGLIMFFINFLLTFSSKTEIDATGSPVSAQVRRLQYLK
jgi:hypothetical protein